jgi:hypothetical protein
MLSKLEVLSRFNEYRKNNTPQPSSGISVDVHFNGRKVIITDICLATWKLDDLKHAARVKLNLLDKFDIDLSSVEFRHNYILKGNNYLDQYININHKKLYVVPHPHTVKNDDYI